MFNTEQLQEKWAPVLSHGDLPEIKDSYKKAVTCLLYTSPSPRDS